MVLLSGGMGEAYNVANESGKITIRELAELLCNMFPEKKIKANISEARCKLFRKSTQKFIQLQSTDKLKKLGLVSEF